MGFASQTGCHDAHALPAAPDPISGSAAKNERLRQAVAAVAASPDDAGHRGGSSTSAGIPRRLVRAPVGPAQTRRDADVLQRRPCNPRTRCVRRSPAAANWDTQRGGIRPCGRPVDELAPEQERAVRERPTPQERGTSRSCRTAGQSDLLRQAAHGVCSARLSGRWARDRVYATRALDRHNDLTARPRAAGRHAQPSPSVDRSTSTPSATTRTRIEARHGSPPSSFTGSSTPPGTRPDPQPWSDQPMSGARAARSRVSSRQRDQKESQDT